MTQRVARYLEYVLLSPALLPLVYAQGFLYPYVAPKTFLFRGLGILALAAIVYLVLMRHELYWFRLKNKLTWIPAALLAVTYATSLIGVDFYHSFWSTYERGDGLITLTAAVVFFYGVVLYADRRFFKRLMILSAWVGGLAALYALLQWVQATAGIDIPLIEEPRGRYGGTFGNAAFLASYLAMTFFLTLAIVGDYRKKWRGAVYTSAALQLVAIFLSSTRGTILALAASGFVAAAYVAWKGEGRMRLYARLTLVALIVLVGVFVIFRGQLAKVPLSPVQRIATISLSDGTIVSRLFLWQNIGHAALKKPLTGVGAEHIEVLFNHVYDPDKIQEEWFDRSHNAFLDYFAQFGVLGLLLYVVLVLSALVTAHRIFKTDMRVGGLMMLLIATYAIQNFFVFDTALTLWLLFAVFAGLINMHESGAARAARLARVPASLAAGLAVAFLVLIYPVSIQPMRANRLIMETYLYHVADVPLALQHLDQGLSLGTYADLEYGYQAYGMYTNEQVTMLSGETRLKAYTTTLDLLRKNFDRYPYDARTAMYLAHVLDLTPPEATVDEVLLNTALDKEISISPRRLQAWYIRANISLKKGDAAKTKTDRAIQYTAAIAVMKTYADMQPGSADPRYIIANLYLAIGDKRKAEEWADAGESVYRGGEAARRAAKYYINAEEWGKAVRFLSDVVASNPDNAGALYDLAKVKFLSGDKAGAREIYERLKAQNSDLVATDPAFVRAIDVK